MIAAVKQNKCNLSRNFGRHHLQPFELLKKCANIYAKIERC